MRDEDGRPWWATGPGGSGGADERDGAGEGGAREPHATPGDAHASHPHGEVCQVCPVCALLRVVSEVRPEVMEHLIEASRHLTLAAKAVVDTHAEGFAERDDDLQRIDLDED